MEGLLDYILRDTLTRLGGVDRCVSEFIRVTNTLLPERVFTRVVPELLQGGCTRAGVPVRPQLLGSDPVCLAENAARVAGMGPYGVDLNFGCPAKVVNRHGGGAALLQEPELIASIVSAVRRAVPAGSVVSAKMRLGFHDTSLALDCARAIADSGADELVVHARTRADGYRPPAYWEQIPLIRAAVGPQIRIIANGEIWTVQDALRCREQSGCTDLMLGRGSVADPGLALAIRAAVVHGVPAADSVAPIQPAAVPWAALLPHMQQFWDWVCQRLTPNQRAGRLKQWLNLLRRRYPEAETAYQQVRVMTDQTLITQWLALQRSQQPMSVGVPAPANLGQ